MTDLTGGCLCGDVRYRSISPALRIGICHCTHCQKQSGGAFSVFAAFPVDAVEITGETVAYLDEGSSGHMVIRRFCGRCGSALFSDLAAQPGIRIIKAGTLDNVRDLAPQFQIWCDSAQPWLKLDEPSNLYPKAPG